MSKEYAAMTEDGHDDGRAGRSRGRRWVARFLQVCGLVLLLLVVGLICFHERLIDSIYKNVADITDGEMPVTVTAFPSGPEVTGIIGGAGKGLNCSLPPLADLFFEDGNPGPTEVPGAAGESKTVEGTRHLVRQKFRQACVFHDLCYRHGLATYGYSQNDCDRILQEQAHRLCEYLPKSKKSDDQCQLDAKKVLAGVSLGGFGSYHAWDRSTYFEFDAHPLRAQRFSVSRVVDHPFKGGDPEKYRNESNQVILTFESKRSELKVRCANCGDQVILPASFGVSPELVSAGIQTRPSALINRSLKLNDNRTVWLPPWRDHAAPRLLPDAAGQHWIVWTSRAESQNTMVCMVISDSRQLLTYTLPQTNACSSDARSSLRLEEFDIFSSAPQPGVSPQGGVVTTGLTWQQGPGLMLCRWPHATSAGSAQPSCLPLRTADHQDIRDLGAFQSFPIVKAHEHIYVSRAITDDPGLQHRVTLRHRLFGDWYSPKGQALIVRDPYRDGGSIEVRRVRFDIPDAYDPMVPLSRAPADKQGLMSLVAKRDKLEAFRIDLANDWPTPAPLKMRMNAAELVLHDSWAARPPLILETSQTGTPKSQLVLSRAMIAPSQGRGKEDVLFQILLMERGADDLQSPYDVAASAVCKVSYSIKVVRDKVPCNRTFSSDRLMRQSPGAMLRAGQILAGRFNRDGHMGLALPDMCEPSDPIILNRAGASAATFVAEQKPPPPATTKRITRNRERSVACVPTKGPEDMARAMSPKDLLALFN